jgi:hypothetical protein
MFSLSSELGIKLKVSLLKITNQVSDYTAHIGLVLFKTFLFRIQNTHFTLRILIINKSLPAK